MGILDKQFNQFYDLLKEAMDASNEEIENEVKSDLEQEENQSSDEEETTDDVPTDAEEESNEDIILNTFEDEFEELTDDMIEDSEKSFLELDDQIDEDEEEEDNMSDEDLEAEKAQIDAEEESDEADDKEIDKHNPSDDEDDDEDDDDDSDEEDEEETNDESDEDDDEVGDMKTPEPPKMKDSDKESDDEDNDEEDDESDDDAGNKLANHEPPKVEDAEKEEAEPKKDLAEDFIPFAIETLHIKPRNLRIVNNKFVLRHEGMTMTFNGVEFVNFIRNNFKEQMLNECDELPEELQTSKSPAQVKINMLKSYELMFNLMDKDNNLKYIIPQDKKVMKILNKKTGEQYTTKQYFAGRQYELENKLNDPDHMTTNQLSYIVQGWMNGSIVRGDLHDLNPDVSYKPTTQDDLDLVACKHLVKECEEYEGLYDENEDDKEINSIMRDFASDDLASTDPNGVEADEEDLLVSLANEDVSPVNSVMIRKLLIKNNRITPKEEKLIKMGMVNSNLINRLSKRLICEQSKVVDILKYAYLNPQATLTVFKEESLPEMKKEEIDDPGQYQKFKNRVGNLLDLKREKEQLEDEKSNMDKNELKRKGKNITDEKQAINNRLDTVKDRIDNEKEELNLTVSKYERKK